MPAAVSGKASGSEGFTLCCAVVDSQVNALFTGSKDTEAALLDSHSAANLPINTANSLPHLYLHPIINARGLLTRKRVNYNHSLPIGFTSAALFGRQDGWSY
jgi:hypothetical protein